MSDYLFHRADEEKGAGELREREREREREYLGKSLIE